MGDHLHRLRVQGIVAALGLFLQLLARGPLRVLRSCLAVAFHTVHPHPGRFHLRCFQGQALPFGQVPQRENPHRVHDPPFAPSGTMIAQHEDGMQTGKTRWTDYSIAYHFVWIPKYRRKILTGEVQKATKDLLNACCQRHGLALLALETDLDHVHLFVSAPPRFSPADIANLLKGYASRYLRSSSPISRRSAAQTICGPQPTLLARLARFRLKLSGAILLSVKENDGLAAIGALIPIP